MSCGPPPPRDALLVPIRRRLIALAAAVGLGWAAGGAAAPPAGAAGVAFVGCASASGFECTSLPVPLDRSGGVPGAISLSVERREAAREPTRTAVLALAGGPGQSTLPLAKQLDEAIAPALASRDLLLFDQRGTGFSDPLACSPLEELSAADEGRLKEQCALDIGPARRDFTTAETVQDIESLRQATGYERLVLYGTSYGTKVALDYAEAYPQRVEALVLDSVVPPQGEDPLQLASFESVGPIVTGDLCTGGACSGITANPVGELERLARALRRRPLRGIVYDGHGHRHAASIEANQLFELLKAGDLNPALRALLPAAVHSALRHDQDPLLRLDLISEGLVPNVPSGFPAREHRAATGEAPFDEALNATTLCEETPFPWRRDASPAAREAEALSALRSVPASAFAPFDPTTAWETGLIPGCLRWPDASPPPPAASALPAVPTLILSGAQDLRTPTAIAREVAAQIPGAHLVVVPFTGHSVIGSDLSGCASAAVAAFFAGAVPQPCGPARELFAPTPVTPTRLAYVHPPPGLAGRRGQTLVAVLDALVDLDREVVGAILQSGSELPRGASFGGLRGGYARIGSSAVVLHRFSFVPGVALSGALPVRGGRLRAGVVRISGHEAARGSVRVGSPLGRVSGTLSGRSFSITVARARLSRASGGGWPGPAAVRLLLAREIR